jgi:hypothetical protein
MREQLDRDESTNLAEALKEQAKGMSMDTPKGVQLEKADQSAGKTVAPRQGHEYGHQKPSNDLTGILKKSVKQARKARGQR